MFRFFLFLILISSQTHAAGCTIDVQVGPQDRPGGAVILVVDGLGSSYVYPEHSAYALDGSRLEKAILFNLTGDGARVVDVRVPVPETTKSHAVLVTGSAGTDPLTLGPTIFDAARQEGYLCIAILERGDSMPILQRQDAVLYLGDNAIHGAQPIFGLRPEADANLSGLLQVWRDRFGDYTRVQGTAGYAAYNSWGLDAAADLVQHLGNRSFLLLVNVGGVDSAGQDLGADDYVKTVQALDAPLGRLAGACRENDVLLVVTADHGMCFPGPDGKGGHSAAKYAQRLESLRVPLVFSGPGVEELNLAGRWSETDIAATVLDLLHISGNISREGKSIPLRQSYDLTVSGAPAGLELWRGEERLAGGAAAGEYRFLGLERGLYSLRVGERVWEVLLNGDVAMNLAGNEGLPSGIRKILGVVLILAINLAGIALIYRIWKKD